MIKSEQDVIDYYIEMCYKSVNEFIESANTYLNLPGVETGVWLCKVFIEKCKSFRIHNKNASESKLKSLDVCINACDVCMNHCTKYGIEELKTYIKSCWLWVKECEMVLKGSTANLLQRTSSICLAQYN